MKEAEIISLLAKYNKDEVFEILYQEAVNNFFSNKFTYVGHDTDFLGFIKEKEKLNEESGRRCNCCSPYYKEPNQYTISGFVDIQINKKELRHKKTGIICNLSHIDCQAAYNVLIAYKGKHQELIGNINETLKRCKREIGKFRKLNSVNQGVFKALTDKFVPENINHKWTHYENSSLLEYEVIDPSSGCLVTKSLMVNHDPYLRDLINGNCVKEE